MQLTVRAGAYLCNLCIVVSYWHGLVVSRQTFFNFSSRTYTKKIDLLYIWSKTWTNRHYGSAITPYPVRVHTLYSQYLPHMLYIVPTYHYNGPSRLLKEGLPNALKSIQYCYWNGYSTFVTDHTLAKSGTTGNTQHHVSSITVFTCRLTDQVH